MWLVVFVLVFWDVRQTSIGIFWFIVLLCITVDTSESLVKGEPRPLVPSRTSSSTGMRSRDDLLDGNLKDQIK